MALGEIYIKLVVSFPNDPKVRALARYGAEAGLARDLYVQMCLYCKDLLSDGFVPEDQIGLLVYPLDMEHGKQLAKQLASVGLTKESSKDGASGWDVLAFLKRNGSREDVKRLSEVRAEAGRTGGKAKPKRAGQRGRQASGKQVANQGAQQKESNAVSVSVKNTETDTYQPPTEAGPAHVGTVVGAFVDGATAAGLDAPSTSIKARVGKAARQLLEQGKDINVLIDSARRMGASEYDDLDKQVRIDDARAKGVGANGGGQSTAARKAQAAVNAGAELQQMIDEGRYPG